MEVALRQRLDGVARVAISEGEQTTEVIFAEGDHAFSLEAFRLALRQADVEIVTVHVEACGVVAGTGEARRLRAGKTEFLLRGAEAPAEGNEVCVSGRLDDRAGQMEVVAGTVQPAPASLNPR